jgi:hypothetical protein
MCSGHLRKLIRWLLRGANQGGASCASIEVIINATEDKQRAANRISLKGEEAEEQARREAEEQMKSEEERRVK